MAADVNLLKSFVDGQGAGAATYANYPGDHDANYTAIQTAINQINAEIAAFSGQSATLVSDLLTSPSAPLVVSGFVDATSFAPVAFLSGDTQIQIPPGVALTGVGKVELLPTSTLTGSGVSGARFVALRQNGTVTLETLSSQGVMDLYSVTWDGAQFTTATLLRLETVLPAGHDFQNLRIQENYGQGSDAAIPPFTYDRIADRIADIVRIMGGELVSADADQAALLPIAIGGTLALPGLTLGDGATYDRTTGLFGTPGSSVLGVTVLATEVMRFAESVANQPQALLRNGTALATPPLAFIDSDNGLGYVATDEWRLIAGGIEALRVIESAGAARVQIQNGTAALPALSFQSDPNTGLRRVAEDHWALVGAGADELEGNPQGQINSATQGRVSASVASVSVGNSGTLANTVFDTEVADVGGYFTASSADFTVPTGHGGRFAISGEVEFPAGNLDGIRHVAIEVNGAAVRQQRLSPASAGVTIVALSIDSISVTAGQVVRLQTAHTDTSGALNVRAELNLQRIV